MKKILFIFLVLLLASCATRKGQVAIQTTKTDSVVSVKEIVKEVFVTNPIKDTIIKQVVVSQNCQDEVDKALRNVSFSKSSGNNNFKLLYDEATKKLKFYINQDGHKTQYIEQLEKEVNQTTEVREVPVEVPIEVNRLKNWQIILMILGGAFIAMQLYKLKRFVPWT